MYELYNNILLFIGEQKWSKIETKGYQPRGRRSLSAVRYGDNKILYFGGFNNRIKRHFNDVFVFDAGKRETGREKVIREGREEEECLITYSFTLTFS